MNNSPLVRASSIPGGPSVSALDLEDEFEPGSVRPTAPNSPMALAAPILARQPSPVSPVASPRHRHVAPIAQRQAPIAAPATRAENYRQLSGRGKCAYIALKTAAASGVVLGFALSVAGALLTWTPITQFFGSFMGASTPAPHRPYDPIHQLLKPQAQVEFEGALAIIGLVCLFAIPLLTYAAPVAPGLYVMSKGVEGWQLADERLALCADAARAAQARRNQ